MIQPLVLLQFRPRYVVMSKIGLGGQAYPRVGQPLSGGRSLTSWIGAWCRRWWFTPGKDFAQLEAMRVSIIDVFLVGRLQDALRIR